MIPYVELSWFESIQWAFGMMLPFLVILAVVVYLIVQAVKALVKYVRSGDIRRRRAERSRARELGGILRDCRIGCGLTPESVAGSVGVSRKAVLRWERGATVLNTANLLPLAELYGVPVEDLQGARRA